MRWVLGLCLLLAACSSSASPTPKASPSPSPPLHLTLDALDGARLSLACDQVNLARLGTVGAQESAVAGLRKVPGAGPLVDLTEQGRYGDVLAACVVSGASPQP